MGASFQVLVQQNPIIVMANHNRRLALASALENPMVLSEGIHKTSLIQQKCKSVCISSSLLTLGDGVLGCSRLPISTLALSSLGLC